MQSSHESEDPRGRAADGSGRDAPRDTPPRPSADAGPRHREHASAEPEGEQPDLGDELARIEDRYRRALADLDNYRKRATREVDRRVAEAREAALRDWLLVVDSVERAIGMEPDGPCYDGLRAILQQIDMVLDRQGAKRIGDLGDTFDPERHEAVAVRASEDVPERTVVEVQRSGVAQGDRVIRPAQVVVARAPEHAH
ncbi:MAG TPA: nucleotide exchange factor GrpE [Solirubrobacteraceae bacterium]|nr:nucleotide exchange factor GrpE [Solirubrobacteraceae bacterium]